MEIAKIQNNTIVIGDYREIFPNVSFDLNGPSDQFLSENNCFRVGKKIPYNEKTHKLVRVDPYINNGVVYTFEVVELTSEEIATILQEDKERFKIYAISQTSARLNEFAQTRGYDNITSAVSYASSSIPKYSAEGQYALVARDTTWSSLFSIFEEIDQGTRSLPVHFYEIEPDLPVLSWPTN